MAWLKGEPVEGILAPDLNDVIRDNNDALEIALNKEMNFSTGGTASLQGILKQGSARMFSQASAPAIRVDGSAFASTDLGLIWIDTDNNKIYTLTATTPTWTLISTEIIATLLAAARTFAAAVTFDVAAILSKAPTLTEGIVANNSYLQGRNQADDGNVNLIKVGTNNLSTLPDGAEMASSAAPVEDEAIANVKYVNDKPVNGTLTAVYTKYLTGTLTAAVSENIAHGVTSGLTKILSVTFHAFNDNASWLQFSITENHSTSTAAIAFAVGFDATNIILNSKGDNIKSNNYRIRIDYIL